MTLLDHQRLHRTSRWRMPFGKDRFRPECVVCDRRTTFLVDEDTAEGWLSHHVTCPRIAEVQGMIDTAKESGTHYLVCRGSVDGYGLWVVRCRWCGCYGPDLPSPESALRTWSESEHHGPAVEGEYRCEQDNPWHPDPDRKTRGY